MYAKIITDNDNIYYSPVLYLKYGFSSWAVIFDESLNKLIKIKYWSLKNKRPNISLIDYDATNYKIFSTSVKSIWDKRIDILRCKLNKFSDDQLKFAKEFIRHDKIEEYSKISNENDLKTLDDVSGGFHDSYLIKYARNNEYDELLFNTTWGSYISILVKDVEESSVLKCVNVFDSKFQISNKKVQIDFNPCCNDDAKPMKLIANEMYFKSYFEKKITINQLDNFEINDNNVIVSYNNERSIIPLINNIIFSDDDDYIELFFISETIIYNLTIVNRNNKIDELVSELKKKSSVDEIDIHNHSMRYFLELDKMIDEYNKINYKEDYGKKYDSFIKIYNYILQLRNSGIIITDSTKKELEYLKLVLDEEVSDDSYIISFNPTDARYIKYEIGVYVRGVPLIRKL